MERQRSEKLARVQGALQFLARGEALDAHCAAVSWHPVAAPIGYRNRIRLRIDDAGRVRFFNPEKAPSCAVLEPELAEGVQRVLAMEGPSATLFQFYDYMELCAPDRNGRFGLYLGGPRWMLVGGATWAHSERVEVFISNVRQALARAQPDLLGRLPFVRIAAEGATGEEDWPDLTHELGAGVYARVPVGGFLQVNHTVNRALVARVVSRAVEQGAHSVADLYCGSGNFLLPLCAAGIAGTGVETNARAVRACSAAAAEQGLALALLNEQVDVWLQRQRDECSPRPDLVVVDPPRAGIKSAVTALGAWAPPRLAYCSCNPETLAKDISALSEHGYRVESVELFDMFPHTVHVEVLAWLTRPS